VANEYPECKKLTAARNDSQVIGDFVMWLETNGYYICERRKPNIPVELPVPQAESRTAEHLGDAFVAVLQAIADTNCVYWPIVKRLPDALLAEYFEIDLEKLDDERRAMLDEYRQNNEKAANVNQ
jgi:hypothetical protein